MEFDLVCDSVCKNFGSLKAVDDVSFGIPKGSFFSILGPSGCGKTTLMRMIAGFETPTSGDIKIKGSSVVATPPNKRNVKMVFQHLALFPMMNVFENIAYGLRCNGVDRGEIGSGFQTSWNGSDCRMSPRRKFINFPAARNSASPSPAAWFSIRTSCCSTNHLARWI